MQAKKLRIPWWKFGGWHYTATMGMPWEGHFDSYNKYTSTATIKPLWMARWSHFTWHNESQNRCWNETTSATMTKALWMPLQNHPGCHEENPLWLLQWSHFGKPHESNSGWQDKVSLVATMKPIWMSGPATSADTTHQIIQKWMRKERINKTWTQYAGLKFLSNIKGLCYSLRASDRQKTVNTIWINGVKPFKSEPSIDTW